MPADDATIHPFKVSFPEAELTELRRRVTATRWPERETVTDDSQGVPLTMMQDLARYWAADYDWRPCETRTWWRSKSRRIEATKTRMISSTRPLPFAEACLPGRHPEANLADPDHS